jgi:hypothetical protein
MNKIIILLLGLLMMGASAQAGFELVMAPEIVIAAGDSSTSVTFTMEGCIREMFLEIPTLDANDSSNIALVMTPFGSLATLADTATVVPNGWSDKEFSDTEDNAVVRVFSSRASIDLTGIVTITVSCETAQEADRVFRCLMIREY